MAFKYFTNISYNTDEFLKNTLIDLVKSNILMWAAFIPHEADVDTKKAHKHIVLLPAKQSFDPSKVYNLFLEPDLSDTSKPPLGVTQIWHTTPEKHESDLFLYDIHDKVYLDFKGLVRTHYDYPIASWWSTDPDYIDEVYARVQYPVCDSLESFIARLESDKVQHDGEIYSFLHYVKKGYIPVNRYNQYKDIYKMVNYDPTLELKDRYQRTNLKYDYDLPFSSVSDKSRLL